VLQELYRFQRLSKSALYPPQPPPGSKPGLGPASLPRLLTSRQHVLDVGRVPVATDCCRNTTRVERFSGGGYSSGGGGGDLRGFGLSVFAGIGGCTTVTGTTAHGAVEVSRLLPGVWRLVVPRAVPCLLSNHLRDPFVDSKQRQVAGLFTVSQNTSFTYPAPRIHLGQQANLDASTLGSKQPGSRVVLE
jgi:hypothetical protein